MPGMVVVRRYASRILLVALMFLFLACDEEGGCGVSEWYCEHGGQKWDEGTLTSTNPSLRVATDTATLECGATCNVYYSWESETPGLPDPARKRPPVTVKFGTREKGVNITAKSEPADGGNYAWLATATSSARELKEGQNPTEVHYVAVVTLNQPLIKTPTGGLTIALPLLGTIIGPKPEPVDVRVVIDYRTPAGQK